MRGLVPTIGGGFTLLIAALAGCYNPLDDASGAPSPASQLDGTEPGASATGGSSGGTTAGGTGEAGAAARGLPCDVDAVLEAKCRACHGSTPSAPMALVTYEDLAAPSKSDPSKTNAAKAIERMKAEAGPMPPFGDRVAAPEIGAFETWVAAGLPRGTCGAPSPEEGGSTPSGTSSSGTPAPVATLKCSSGTKWDPDNDEGPNMNPGRACITCHQAEKGTNIVKIGGTLYPTLLEENLCYGVDGAPAAAEVVVTDSAGKTFPMAVGPTGNFSYRGTQTVAFPITAKVLRGGKVVNAMSTPQMTGDCNSCHAEKPVNGAPGRILMP